MVLCRLARRRGIRRLGITALILGLVHMPLPQPDFHNVRHHDTPGEVCEHHDHLLRWHPDAGLADDVAVLHWHWFLPTAGPSDQTPGPEGPALHAHLVDWFASNWDDGPQVSADNTTSRLIGPRETATALALLVFEAEVYPGVLAPEIRPAVVAGAPIAPSLRTASLLQRWTC
jgi:hypothetical protein